MIRKTASTINDAELDALYAEVERGRRAEALLVRFTAEAHRRKWAHDAGLDVDGQPLSSPAFEALHRLGDEMNTALHALRAHTPGQEPPSTPHDGPETAGTVETASETLNGPQTGADGFDGPSVEECAAADRVWPLQRAGE